MNKYFLLTLLAAVPARAQVDGGIPTSAAILAGSVGTAALTAGAVNTTKLATDAVTASAILNGTITAAKLAAGAVISLASANTWTATQSFSVSTSTQSRDFGYSAYSGASNANGRHCWGSTAGFEFCIDLDALNGIVRFLNTQNSNSDQILFGLKTAGTEIIPLAITGTGIAARASPTTTIMQDGSLYVNGSTFTVAASGIVSAPSQSGAKVCKPNGGATFVINNGVQDFYYWSDASTNKGFNTQASWNTVSSNTITARGAGYYLAVFNTEMAATGSTGPMYASFYVNGGQTVETAVPSLNTFQSIHLSATMLLADGDTVAVKVLNSSGAARTMGANDSCIGNNFSLVKLW